MKIKWKFYHDKYININGIRTRYWDVGNGEKTIVLIHGFLSSIENWSFIIPFFEKRCRLIALDMPGHGRTEKPSAPYTYEYHTSFLNDFLNIMNIKKMHAIGHSMGGPILIQFALKYPMKVDKLVLVAPPFSMKYSIFFRLPTLPIIGEFIMRPPASYKGIQNFFRIVTYNYIEWPEEALKRYYEFQNSKGYKKAALRYLRNYFNIFGLKSKSKKEQKIFNSEISNLKQPVLLVWGKQDVISPYEASEILIKNIPNIIFWDLDHCGHNPQYEYPDEFNKQVKEFLF